VKTGAVAKEAHPLQHSMEEVFFLSKVGHCRGQPSYRNQSVARSWTL